MARRTGAAAQCGGLERARLPNIGAQTPPFVTVWYTRDMQLGPIVVAERAVFGGDDDDPTRVIVEVYRELHLSR